MTGFTAEVEGEITRARCLHPWRYPTLHHGYAVLLEEVEEFKDEVFRKSENRDYLAMYKELAQIGAMAQRIAEDIIAEHLL
jgi:hypothetical protein